MVWPLSTRWEAICRAVPAHIRVRLGSLEPRTITPEFCRRAAALPNLCPPLPPVYAVRVRLGFGPHEPKV